MEKEKPTIFSQLRDHLDKLKVGESITRREIRKMFEILPGNSGGALDNYRRLFCKAHYFEAYNPATGKSGDDGYGAYRKIREFDSEIVATVGSLQKECKELLNAIYTKSSSKLSREEVESYWEWDKKWEESRMTAKDFLHKHRGVLTGNKFGF